MPGMGMPGMNFAAGGAGRGGVKGAVDEGEANKPKDNEIGYALPIKLTYRVSNIKGWEFIYEVLRRNPLAELHRVLIRSMSVYDPANTDIEMTLNIPVRAQAVRHAGPGAQDADRDQAG